MVNGRSGLVLVVLGLAVAGCGSDDEAEAAPLRLPDDGLGASCHPFRSAGVCGLPFPSNVYLEEDAETETGFRVNLPSELLPASAATDAPFDPVAHNRADGFSPATPILAYLPEKLSASSLPSQANFDESLSPDSATLLLDLETNELVAHFSELDLSADIEPTDRQPLMLRPARHLRPNAHYAVALTTSLRTADGLVPARPVGFASAVAGATSDDPVAKKALGALPKAVSAFAAVGVAKQDLLLVWDFRTGSLEQMTRNVLTMRDRALQEVGSTGIGYVIASVEDAPSPEIWRRIRGTFSVPSFLSSDDRSEAETALVLGSDGLPERQRVAQYPFELVIPASAEASGPYPLLVYGHGLLGAANQVSSGHVREFCNAKGYVCIATDWIGLSEQEEGGIGQSNAAWLAIQDINRFAYVGDRLQQAQLNFMVLTRTAQSILADADALLPGGVSALDATATPVYYGISQGGIMGASLLGYSPDIERGVCQVGGSAYSLMIQRSVNWNQFLPAIRNAYPDRVAQQLLMALWQPEFDRSEGSGTAWAQGKNPPLPGTPPKALLLQIAVGDSQVANLSAEIQARTLDIPLLSPSPKEVWGLSESPGGEANAISFWDLVRTPPPDTNATPPSDNRVHADIRKLAENQAETDTFLKTGKAENTCGGPCSFPGAEF